jgi:hypothetical protein
MHDEEISELMRRADPARTPLSSPLSLRAEADLARITGGQIETPPGPSKERLSPRWIAIPAVAFVVLFFVFVAQNVVPSHNAIESAQAATPPLLEGTGDRLEIDVVLAKATAAINAGSVSASTRGSRYEAWFLDTKVGADGMPNSLIVPQRYAVTWSPDLSGEIETTFGQAYKADGRPAPEPSPSSSEAVSTTTFAPDEMGILFQDLPPTSPDDMAEYLASHTGRDVTDSVQLAFAVAELQNEWQLGTNERIAVLQLLSRSTSTPLGHVTDRLGREGYGFEVVSTTDKVWKAVFVVSADTGAVIDIEQIYLGGLPDLDVMPPAVTSYTAWE